jgi:CRP/FNR family transcriptional regulator, cyclic AMP receptor protein
VKKRAEAEMKSRAEYIRNIPLFEGLDEEELRGIEGIMKERYYKKNSIVVSEGNQGDSMFIVKSGKVKIYKTDVSGKEIILDVKGENKMFGEVTLFTEVDYPATVKTIEDSEIFILENRELEKVVEGSPKLSLSIIKVLGKRLLKSQQKLKELVMDDVYMRTARELLSLAEKYGKKKDGSIELELGLTREEIANIVGTSRETVSRVLSRFGKEGSIEIEGRKISIVDEKKLRGWLE